MTSDHNNIEENSEEPKVHKPYSKYRDRSGESFKFNLNIKSVLPYLVIVLIFVLSLYLVLLIFDGVIMPSIVHNKDLVEVPELIGKSLDEGIVDINNHNLSYKVIQEVYSEEYPARTIVKQSPSANNKIKENRTIYLSISKGMEMVSIPNILGMPLNKARIELIKSGLEVGEISYEHSDFVPRDTIKSQSISAGKLMPYGSSINITVSLGSDSQISVPLLIGLRYDEVLELLEESGFVLGEVSYAQSETYTSNTIIGQYPEAGEYANMSSEINIVISR